MPTTSINRTTGMVGDTLEPNDSAEIERRLGQAVVAREKDRCLNYAQRAVWMLGTAGTLEADVDTPARTLTVEIGQADRACSCWPGSGVPVRGGSLPCAGSSECARRLRRGHLRCQQLRFAKAVVLRLRPGMVVLAVTTGLEEKVNGDHRSPSGALEMRLPEELGGRITFNAIAGQCTAHELSARRQTSVVFTGVDSSILSRPRTRLERSCYRVWTSTDVTGVEVCAALRNVYALDVDLAVGVMLHDGLNRLRNLVTSLVGSRVCRDVVPLRGFRLPTQLLGLDLLQGVQAS